MRKLILVKHSLPATRPDRPAPEWELSADGRRRAEILSDRLLTYGPAVVFSSTESKARQTAAIIAERLGVEHKVRQGLHEHERRTVPLLPHEEFEAAVRRFFERPGVLVFGEETAQQATERFEKAVRSIVAEPADATVIVSHGTVISLLVAAHNEGEPWGLWKQLGLPSFVVLSLPELRVLDVVEEV